MHWWTYVSIAIVSIAAGLAVAAVRAARREDRLHDENVNRRIDEHLEDMDLMRRRPRDAAQIIRKSRPRYLSRPDAKAVQADAVIGQFNPGGSKNEHGDDRQ